MMGTRRITAALVAAALVLGGGMAGSPASAATIPPQCAKQANAVSSAKKSLARAKKIRAKAKRTKAVRAATKKLSVKKKALTRCVKAIVPRPAVNVIEVGPATSRGQITVTFRSPAPAPVFGQQFRIQIVVPGGDREVCAGIATTDRPAAPAGVSYTFDPWGIPPSQIGDYSKMPTILRTWCTGSAAATVYVRDSGLDSDANGTPLASREFTIAP